MYSRDYVYVRRARIDPFNKIMVLVSRAVTHPKIPEDKNHVRVTCYSSKMVIKPHKNFDDFGFDYLLTYLDDPKSSFPSVCYNWMASSGVPDFVDKLHKAALQLNRPPFFENTGCKQTNLNQNKNSASTRSNECIYA